MENIEKYNSAFTEVFGVDASALGADFKKENVEEWDSVHQLSVVNNLEDAFDIMFDPEDIMEMTSYAKGKELLAKYDVTL